jgi:hypothetical protein
VERLKERIRNSHDEHRGVSMRWLRTEPPICDGEAAACGQTKRVRCWTNSTHAQRADYGALWKQSKRRSKRFAELHNRD